MDKIIITISVILTLWYVFRILRRDDEWYLKSKYAKKQLRWMKDQDKLDSNLKGRIQMILAEDE